MQATPTSDPLGKGHPHTLCSVSLLEEVVTVVPLPAGGCHLWQGPVEDITYSLIEAAFILEGVGLAVGSWGQWGHRAA